MDIKTFRRDRLRRLVEAGRVELVGSYHYDDMLGAERTTTAMPVAICPEDRTQRKDGVCYLYKSDFESSGRAWQHVESGIITLYVHSNCTYDLRIKDAARCVECGKSLPSNTQSSICKGCQRRLFCRTDDHADWPGREV